MSWEELVKMQGKDGKTRHQRISAIKNEKTDKVRKEFFVLLDDIQDVFWNLNGYVNSVREKNEGKVITKNHFDALGRRMESDFEGILKDIENLRDRLV